MMNTCFIVEKKDLQYKIDDLSFDKIQIKSFPFLYDVQFIDKIDSLNNFVSNKFDKSKQKRYVFWDKNVFDIYGARLNYFVDRMALFNAVEDNKNIDSVLNLVDKLQDINFTKKETLISVGGGITQDISAFTRAIFKRGIDWLFVPSTLLSMSDSCIGAKTALNHKKVKNQLALFSAPKEVIICKEFLESLSRGDILSGYGEILKLVIIGGNSAVCEFEGKVKKDIYEMSKINFLIKLALIIKKAVIEEDEFEVDIRRSLNYGHTIGHAIEPLANYKIPHGIAVSIGMIIENEITSSIGSLPRDLLERYNRLIADFIPMQCWKIIKDIDILKMLENLRLDKKTLNNTINFAVPIEENEFGICPIDKSDLTEKVLKNNVNNCIEKYAKIGK